VAYTLLALGFVHSYNWTKFDKQKRSGVSERWQHPLLRRLRSFLWPVPPFPLPDI
ncbi:hypothetical protein CHS0354_017848, partial [Potamilus streckersoni]